MKKLIAIFLLLLPIITGKAQQPMYVGGDISVLQSYEDNNVAYYNQQGSRISNVLKYMKSEQVGWNAARVRLFVEPNKLNADGGTDPQVCQDIDYVVRFCKRLKSEGFTIMLDFHYSDTWADPSNQWIPSSWAGLNESKLRVRVYEYTKECLQKLVDEEAAPDFIQTGNEISYGMLWSSEVNRESRVNRCFSDSPESYWTRFVNLLRQASRACREVCPEAKIIIHTERTGDPNALKQIYKKLEKVDYDVIGLSYYPFWHNSLEVLGQSLDTLEQRYPEKMVQIVETAYYYQYQPSEEGGTIYDFSSKWPITPAGQASYTRDLVEELKKHQNVNGLYWWFPEENGNGPDNKVLAGWINRGLWNNSTHRALPALYELKAFAEGSDGIEAINEKQTTGNGQLGVRNGKSCDLQGRYLSDSTHGIIIENNGQTTRKVLHH